MCLCSCSGEHQISYVWCKTYTVLQWQLSCSVLNYKTFQTCETWAQFHNVSRMTVLYNKSTRWPHISRDCSANFKEFTPQTSSLSTYLWTNSTEQPTAISWTNSSWTAHVSFRHIYSLEIINTFVYSLKSPMDVVIFHYRSWVISRWRWLRQCWYGRSWCSIQVTMRLMTQWVSSFLMAHQHIWHIAIWEAHPVGGLHMSVLETNTYRKLSTHLWFVYSLKSPMDVDWDSADTDVLDAAYKWLWDWWLGEWVVS